MRWLLWAIFVDFVRQEEARGIELGSGSDFERALALFLVQRGLRQDRHHGPQVQSVPEAISQPVRS
jgi:hypothetical protein